MDDEKDTALTTAEVLRDAGHEAKAIYDAAKAIDVIGDFDPDVVILDISMPRKTGWELAREIRLRCTGRRPMLIAISGHYTKGADRVLGRMAGFDHYFYKPCDPQVLTTLLSQGVPAK